VSGLVDLDRARATLVAQGCVEPVAPADAQAWLDHELASLVENQFFATLDPRALDAAARQHWTPRALGGEPFVGPLDRRWMKSFWLLDRGERVGTIGFDAEAALHGRVTVWSLYVRPDRRGAGLARSALDRAFAVFRAHGAAGLRIETHWTWQAAVRFYLRAGWWVQGWKHTLVLVRDPGLPRWRVVVDGATARFEAGLAPGWRPLVEARDEGETLAWTVAADVDPKQAWFAPTTFALELATRGWPLVRSEERWACRRSDAVHPEGLARKIAIFEALDRAAGFEVRTPRIPGLGTRWTVEPE
jgi:ribosomal protein S18 acetylase RimI-like enzyme